MKKFVFKNSFFIITMIVFVALTTVFYQFVAISASRYNGVTIVLDAGHGGRDGGSIGVNGTIEKELNLEYVLSLKDKLVKKGYRVELTRKNDDGLYSLTDKNKKTSDRKERMKIIKRANRNMVISVHMNSFADSSAKGATTYYRKGDESGKVCADLIQKSLHEYCGARFYDGKVGDFYMVNSSYYTCVLIECGFISNPEEEKLLNSDSYKNKFTDAVANAVMLYFGQKNV